MSAKPKYPKILIIGSLLLIAACCTLAAGFFIADAVFGIVPTLTPTPSATPIPPTARPTLTPGPPYCVCFGRMIECAEFPSQAAAQECLLYCRIQGLGDYYQLDPDLDGRACSPNP